MNATWLQRQTNEPLFGDFLWSLPENRLYGGKFLIIGGHTHAFSAPAQAYQYIRDAGGGTTRVMLPESVRSLTKTAILDCEFAPATPSGSFSRRSLQLFMQEASWADMVLLPGDLGRNSETAIVLESFISKSDAPITITRDALDYLINLPETLKNRGSLTIVGSLAQIQKLGVALARKQALTFNMNYYNIATWLHALTSDVPLSVVMKQGSLIYSADGGEVSVTKIKNDVDIWRCKLAAYSAVYKAQQPSKPFQAITSAAYKAFLP